MGRGGAGNWSTLNERKLIEEDRRKKEEAESLSMQVAKDVEAGLSKPPAATVKREKFGAVEG